MYFIERGFREAILKRDKYTCQACGYKQKTKPTSIPLKKKNETDADYLYSLREPTHNGKRQDAMCRLS